MDDAEIAATFRREFPEQIAAFRLRLGSLIPTAAWDDLWQSEHDRAFMVAGAVKADLLADLAVAVDRAVTEGRSLEEFRRDFRAIVERRGWHGWTGEGTRRGEAWRTRVIYTTNASVSYAAGRMAQLREGNFRWWVYRHGGSQDPRPQHLAWDGIALPPDHPFWVTHAPPNGWGCSCYVVGARTEAGIRRVGGDPDKTLPDGWQSLDPRTGAPSGIDRGWAYQPGATVTEEIAATADKMRRWPGRLGGDFLTDLPRATADRLSEAYRTLPSVADDLRRWAERIAGERGGAPIGPVMVEPLRQLGLVTRQWEGTWTRRGEADLDGLLWVVLMDALQGRPPDLAALLPILIDEPDSVETSGGEVILRRRFEARGLILTGRFRRRDRALELVALGAEDAA